jgi:hypothetical protein
MFAGSAHRHWREVLAVGFRGNSTTTHCDNEIYVMIDEVVGTGHLLYPALLYSGQ